MHLTQTTQDLFITSYLPGITIWVGTGLICIVYRKWKMRQRIKSCLRKLKIELAFMSKFVEYRDIVYCYSYRVVNESIDQLRSSHMYHKIIDNDYLDEIKNEVKDLNLNLYYKHLRYIFRVLKEYSIQISDHNKEVKNNSKNEKFPFTYFKTIVRPTIDKILDEKIIKKIKISKDDKQEIENKFNNIQVFSNQQRELLKIQDNKFMEDHKKQIKEQTVFMHCSRFKQYIWSRFSKKYRKLYNDLYQRQKLNNNR